MSKFKVICSKQSSKLFVQSYQSFVEWKYIIWLAYQHTRKKFLITSWLITKCINMTGTHSTFTELTDCHTTSGPYFIKVKIILSLKFEINLIFYLIKEFMKHSCLNFFYEIVNKISIKVKRNWNLKNSSRLKDDQFFLNPDFKKIWTFMK